MVALQQARRASAGNYRDLPCLRNGVSHLETSPVSVLWQGVLDALASASRIRAETPARKGRRPVSALAWRQNKDTRIRASLVPRPSTRRSQAIRVRASACDGKDAWPLPRASREGTSQERHQGRQPARESRVVVNRASAGPTHKGETALSNLHLFFSEVTSRQITVA